MPPSVCFWKVMGSRPAVICVWLRDSSVLQTPGSVCFSAKVGFYDCCLIS